MIKIINNSDIELYVWFYDLKHIKNDLQNQNIASCIHPHVLCHHLERRMGACYYLSVPLTISKRLLQVWLIY